MSPVRIAAAAAAVLALAGCASQYANLYPKPLHYRRGVPEPNYGYGPLPTPDHTIPVRPKTWQTPAR